jgi:hypothetical protein
MIKASNSIGCVLPFSRVEYNICEVGGPTLLLTVGGEEEFEAAGKTDSSITKTDDW